MMVTSLSEKNNNGKILISNTYLCSKNIDFLKIEKSIYVNKNINLVCECNEIKIINNLAKIHLEKSLRNKGEIYNKDKLYLYYQFFISACEIDINKMIIPLIDIEHLPIIKCNELILKQRINECVNTYLRTFINKYQDTTLEYYEETPLFKKLSLPNLWHYPENNIHQIIDFCEKYNIELFFY